MLDHGPRTVLRSVDLHQFAQTLTAPARLMRRGQAMPTIHPQPIPDHPLPQRLDAQAQAVPRRQFLHRERRAEIAIVLVCQAQNSSPEGLSVPMIARTATFARHQSGWTVNGKRTTQTINLASSQTQQPARSLNRQTIV